MAVQIQLYQNVSQEVSPELFNHMDFFNGDLHGLSSQFSTSTDRPSQFMSRYLVLTPAPHSSEHGPHSDQKQSSSVVAEMTSGTPMRGSAKMRTMVLIIEGRQRDIYSVGEGENV